MNTLREQDGYPPKYPTAQDAEIPVLVSDQGRLMVSQKPADSGTFNVMCAEDYVKLPFYRANQVRISNNSGKEVAVVRTWDKTILGHFDSDPYVDGQTINGVNGWEGDGVTTPDVRDGDRSPVLAVLQGRRSVLVDGKISKAGPNKDTSDPNIKEVYDGSKVVALVRPRVNSRVVGLGIYDGSKNLALGIYTENNVFGIANASSDAPSSIEVKSDIIRMEIVFAPSTGLYKAYVDQGDGRELVGSAVESGIDASNLSYASYRIGSEGNESVVDQFAFYMLNKDSASFEVMPTCSSSTFSVVESSDEIMVKNLGSKAASFTDKTDPVFLSGFYEES